MIIFLQYLIQNLLNQYWNKMYVIRMVVVVSLDTQTKINAGTVEYIIGMGK